MQDGLEPVFADLWRKRYLAQKLVERAIDLILMRQHLVARRIVVQLERLRVVLGRALRRLAATAEERGQRNSERCHEGNTTSHLKGSFGSFQVSDLPTVGKR